MRFAFLNVSRQKYYVLHKQRRFMAAVSRRVNQPPPHDATVAVFCPQI
jgi:hypothetical protein